MKVLEVNGVKTWVVIAKYRFFSSVKEKSGVIRVTEFKQSCAMQSDGNVGSRGQSLLLSWMSKTKQAPGISFIFYMFLFSETVLMYIVTGLDNYEAPS